MKKRLRIILVWSIVSLLLQFGAYSLLNKQVQSVITPTDDGQAITLQLKATIPSAEPTNVQISYAKDYLAYMDKGTLKVFNLNKQAVVFEKKPPSENDQSLGVLSYQWLPDRNTLLYFYAKKNPNPVTYVTVYPSKTKTQTIIQTPKTVQPKTEDPNQKTVPETPKVVTKEVPAEPKVEKRYGNPQITELYSLELPNSDEDITPDDRFNQSINQFPAGGKIEEWVVSTFTNLMYLTVKSGTTEQLLAIDVMKNVSTLNKSGETIDNMAASDRNGTLYIDSKIGKTSQIVAIDGSKRQTISKNANDHILGINNQKVYIGEVTNNKLVKIKTTADLSVVKSNPSLKTEWEGSIPFSKDDQMLVGSKGQLIINDQQTAYIVTAGQLKEVTLHGNENYVSVDGAELLQLTLQGTSTLAELQPLNP